jgi:hypothetical protein
MVQNISVGGNKAITHVYFGKRECQSHGGRVIEIQMEDRRNSIWLKGCVFQRQELK